MKLSNHQKHKLKKVIFKHMYKMPAPDAKMLKEDKIQHSGQITEWEWFCLEYGEIVRHMYAAIEETL